MQMTSTVRGAGDEGRPDDLLFEGRVHFDSEKEQWYALIDESSYRYESNPRGSTHDRAGTGAESSSQSNGVK